MKFNSPNEHFKLLDNKIILGKSSHQISSKNVDESFDVIVFATRDIEKIKIPSYIRCIDSYAFSGCLNITQVSIENIFKIGKKSSLNHYHFHPKKYFYPKECEFE